MIERLRRAPIGAQVSLMVAAGPFVVATVGLALVPLAAQVALAGEGGALASEVTTAVRAVLLLALVLGALAAAAAGLLLRSSIGSAILAMRAATGAIAGGELAHRVDVGRRDELGALAGAINEMAARLEQLESGRRRMLAGVSHELRTPLTVIHGHAWTLRRSAVDARLCERLELIEDETMRLAALVDELLDAATLHAGGVRMCLEPGDVLALAADATDRFAAEAARREVRLVLDPVDDDMPAEFDAGRLHQALGNLLANAVAHAPRGSDVRVVVGAASGGDGGRLPGWRIGVVNGGSGIPQHLLATIFEPFVQGPGATGRVGLGLSIARDVVRAHGGELTCSSRPGCTEFAVWLPAVRSVEPPPAPPLPAAAGGAAPVGARVPRLVVEQAATS